MPITPFHFGPGAAVHAIAPRRISFLAFCAVNVLIDVESLYNLAQMHYPVQTFFHTYVGATVALAATVLIFRGLQALPRGWLPNFLGWRDLTFLQTTFGAALGAYSHVFLDSIMHQDIEPYWPFSLANPLLGAVSLAELHIGCVAAGVVGVILLVVRSKSRQGRAA